MSRFQILRHPDEIVHVRWNTGCALDEDDAQGLIDTLTALGGEASKVDLLLVDMAEPVYISPRAREMFWSATCMNRLAILGKSSMDHVLVAFALTAPVPTRFFQNEADAISWLHNE